MPPRVFERAIREFWATRHRQARDQVARGTADQGIRGTVTAGKQMDGFLRTIMELMEGVGVARTEMFFGRADTDLPGFFRPTKSWDLVVVREEKLLAALELKSQVGPSFGNNFNNRTEEALGTAVDIWTAYREGLLGTTTQPFLGYLLVLEAVSGSLNPVRVGEHHFKVDPAFVGASYAKRYEVFCRRLVLERQYTAACFLLTDRTRVAEARNYQEPAADVGTEQFLTQLLRTVAAR